MYKLCVAVMFIISTGFAEVPDVKCNPPKFIPDPEKAPLIYYSADSRQCDKFHACSLTSRTITTSFLCEDGFVFDGIRCILPHGVSCEGRELLQDAQPVGLCLRQNGIYKMENTCSEYIHCSRGVATVHKCAGALIFDDQKGVCAHPDQVARGKSECSEEIRYGFTCPVRSGHRLYKSAHDCRAFFTCSYPAYRPHLGGCPFDTVFNEDKQRCDEPKNVPSCEKYYHESS